jgi:hypothetical protein
VEGIVRCTVDKRRTDVIGTGDAQSAALQDPRQAAGEWMQQATLATRARLPLPVLRDVIQPFPIFSEIYVSALKALNSQIAAVRQPDATTAHA